MKRLTLLRHAKSSWRDRQLADHDRPLSGRGKRDAPRMGERLKTRGAKPDLIVSSSALRARATAELVAETLTVGARGVVVDPELYLASPSGILGRIARQDDGVGELVVVGHNPAMTELVNRLLPSFGLTNLPTGGAVAMDVEIDRWEDIEHVEPALAYYDYPKNPLPVSPS